MEFETQTTVLKSEKLSRKKFNKIVCIILAAVFVIATAFSFIDYGSYKKGQKFALATIEAASEMGGTTIVHTSDTYKEKCKDAYDYFRRTYPDITLNGTTYSDAASREALSKTKSALHKILEDGGYNRFYSSSIERWFQCTNIFNYFANFLCFNPIIIVFYLCVIGAALWFILTKKIDKKELIINESSIICKTGKKKSKEFMVSDVMTVETSKNGLKVIGNGFSFKIENIGNADELKTAIMNIKAHI